MDNVDTKPTPWAKVAFLFKHHHSRNNAHVQRQATKRKQE